MSGLCLLTYLGTNMVYSKYKGDSGETSDKSGNESDHQNAPFGVDTPSLKIVTSDTDVSI